MGNALAKTDSFKALSVIDDSDSQFSQSELGDSMGAEGFGPGDLEKIKVPAGGSVNWEVQEESTKHLDVVILAAQDIRVFYNKKYSGGNEAPDCMSLDAVTGVCGEDAPAEITGCCATCPKAVWGSAVDKEGNPTGGQACKQRKAMLVVQPQDSFPFVLNAPSSSLKNLKKYFGRLVSGHGRPFWGVVTRLGLAKVKSANNVPYSVIEPELVRVLDDDEVDAVRGLRETFVPALEGSAPTGRDDSE